MELCELDVNVELCELDVNVELCGAATSNGHILTTREHAHVAEKCSVNMVSMIKNVHGLKLGLIIIDMLQTKFKWSAIGHMGHLNIQMGMGMGMANDPQDQCGPVQFWFRPVHFQFVLT